MNNIIDTSKEQTLTVIECVFLIQGDDGGPLVSGVDGTWYLVGVASRTSLCGEQASLYTRMTEFYGWLSPIFDGYDPDGKV